MNIASSSRITLRLILTNEHFGNVYRLDKAPKYVAYGPLTKTEFVPDVVLMVMGVIGFGMMLADKGMAGLGKERISERTLFLLAFAGGSWGILLGRFIFHHKVSKPEFLILPLFALILWVVV